MPHQLVGPQPGTCVWLPDSIAAWVKGEVISTAVNAEISATIIKVALTGSSALREIVLRSDEGGEGLKLCNIDENGVDSDGIDNLIKLPHLHEPAILHAIQSRSRLGKIYTFTGPILIAVNPFKTLSLYGDQTIQMYEEYGKMKVAGVDCLSELPPHVFGVADVAYRSMIWALWGNAPGICPDQSLLVSGESGAGKTETTKFVMRYLATIASTMKVYQSRDPQSSGKGGTVRIERQVLESNPILEAFGNARTVRNDNSSRFGKYIRMQFEQRGALVGASINTYLLEKVRLVAQAREERNYHIFYELIAGLGPDSKFSNVDAEMCSYLGLMSPESFHYLNRSGCCTRRDGVQDAAQFDATVRAMMVVGFSETERALIFSIVAALLHLGNVVFEEIATVGGQDEASRVAASGRPSLLRAASLLSIDAAALEFALTRRCIETKEESVLVTLGRTRAEEARDGLAKAIYSRLFDALVMRINASIRGDRSNDRERGALFETLNPSTTEATGRDIVLNPCSAAAASIGVLDIFGFEVFGVNSFEQLCINYANECLQQQFNQFVFSMEQSEYESEGIRWSFVSFPDNSPAVQLIEGGAPVPPNMGGGIPGAAPTVGILSLIDQVCLLNGNDKTLAGRLNTLLADNPRYGVTATQRASGKFTVRHYAGLVVYSVQGFCDKNRDQLLQESLDLMQSSRAPLLRVSFSPAGLAGSAFAFKFSTDLAYGLRRSGSTVLTAESDRSETSFPLKVWEEDRSALVADVSAVIELNADGISEEEQRILIGTQVIVNETGAIEKWRVGELQRRSLATVSLGFQFKSQLGRLLKSIGATTPHYIRCLKPNDENQPDVLNRVRVVEQLRYGGVLEAVRVARAGYPVRYPYSQFLKRYALLSSSKLSIEGISGLTSNPQQNAENLVLALLVNSHHFRSQNDDKNVAFSKIAVEDRENFFYENGIAFGKTKIFFRKHAFEAIEARRAERLDTAAIEIQRRVIGLLARRRYNSLKIAARILHAACRGMLARAKVRRLRMLRAAVRVQARMRAWIRQKNFLYLKVAVTHVQSHFRRRIAAFIVDKLRRKTRLALMIQCLRRCQLARRATVCRRREMREVGGLQRELKTLQLTVQSLKVRAMEAENNANILAATATKQAVATVEQERNLAIVEAVALRESYESLQDRFNYLKSEKELKTNQLQAENDMLQSKLDMLEMQYRLRGEGDALLSEELAAATQRTCEAESHARLLEGKIRVLEAEAATMQNEQKYYAAALADAPSMVAESELRIKRVEAPASSDMDSKAIVRAESCCYDDKTEVCKADVSKKFTEFLFSGSELNSIHEKYELLDFKAENALLVERVKELSSIIDAQANELSKANADKDDAQERFKNLSRSYTLLVTYAEARFGSSKTANIDEAMNIASTSSLPRSVAQARELSAVETLKMVVQAYNQTIKHSFKPANPPNASRSLDGAGYKSAYLSLGPGDRTNSSNPIYTPGSFKARLAALGRQERSENVALPQSTDPQSSASTVKIVPAVATVAGKLFDDVIELNPGKENRSTPRQ